MDIEIDKHIHHVNLYDCWLPFLILKLKNSILKTIYFMHCNKYLDFVFAMHQLTLIVLLWN